MIDDDYSGYINQVLPGDKNYMCSRKEMMFASDTKIVFAGDSVTDCGRRLDVTVPLGNGYVSLVAEELGRSSGGLLVVNAGINGNRSRDLENRWDVDVLAELPSIISIMIGINDTWRRFDRKDPTPADVFETNYRAIIERSKRFASPEIVLMEPFLLPVSSDQQDWLEDLELKIDVVNRLADEFGTPLMKTHEVMTAAARNHGPEALAPDGVHPSALGHKILAGQWLELMA